jgi:GT2 family glycosyltransferase
MGNNRICNCSKINFTVVVPTHGRVSFIKNLFVSFQEALSKFNGEVEIFIIDSSQQEDSKKIESLCKQYGARYIKGPLNVREKRNIGIEQAKGEIILFVDSDCELTPNIFKEHLKMYDEPNTGCVLGVTEFIGKESFTWKIVKRTKFLDAFYFAKTLSNYIDSAPWGTCTNLSCKKKILQEVRGFDTTFPFRLGGDDVDLGIRINKAGYRIKMNPNAVVLHTYYTWSNLLAVAKRVFRWGRMDYYVFYKKHIDKLSLALPKPIIIFFLLLFLALIKIAINSSIANLFLPFFWFFMFLSLNSSFKVISSNESLKNIFLEIPAQFLHFLFDFGTTFESIKNKSLQVFLKEPLDDPRQIILSWNEKVIKAWSIILSVFIVLLILMVI